MNDIIYDASSIFMQILQNIAPEHVNDSNFLMIGYASACLFVLLTMFCLYKILSAFVNVVLGWMSRS